MKNTIIFLLPTPRARYGASIVFHSRCAKYTSRQPPLCRRFRRAEIYITLTQEIGHCHRRLGHQRAKALPRRRAVMISGFVFHTVRASFRFPATPAYRRRLPSSGRQCLPTAPYFRSLIASARHLLHARRRLLARRQKCRPSLIR